jgi:hypothetical protein
LSKLKKETMAPKPNIYQPKLIQIRPQYSVETDAPDKPENILWFQAGTAGVPTAEQLSTVQGVFDAHWPSVWGAVAGDVADYTGSVISDWSSNTGAVLSSVGTLTPVTGTHGSLLPPQVSVLMSYQVALRYKGGHPRTYLPYIGQEVITGTYNDTVVESAATNLQTAWDSFQSYMQTVDVLGGYAPVVYYFKNTVGKAQVGSMTGMSVAPRIATQRRRNRRVAHK